MLSLLTQRLALYAYSDAVPDSGYDNATYTFQTYAWGRIEPRSAARDKTVAGAAIAHRQATITLRDQISLADFSLVVDPVSGDQWRITGTMPRQMARCTQYTADYAPQMPLTASGLGP
jgi:hypothetical protein